jgi:AcrR family transcriptional regulator
VVVAVIVVSFVRWLVTRKTENAVLVNYACSRIWYTHQVTTFRGNTEPEAAAASGGLRKRMRAALTAEILEVGRAHLARDGAAALSLRAVARDVDLVPSALYRYYPGRDALLTALVLDSYASLADKVEAADPGPRTAPAARWVALSEAVRDWALERPHEWALLFGSPVPGYEAPRDTVAYYQRITSALTAPVRDAYAEVDDRRPSGAAAVSRSVMQAVTTVADALVPGLPKAVAADVVLAWEQLVGAVSLEVFGHWRNTIDDPAVVFAFTARTTAALLGL